jgi:hypothetical protein
VTGKTKDFLFDPNDSATDIAQFVFDHWPQDWIEEAVPRAEILRLIYQGMYHEGLIDSSHTSHDLTTTPSKKTMKKASFVDSHIKCLLNTLFPMN